MATKRAVPARRSRGAVALSLLEQTDAELSVKLDVSRRLVSSWKTGERVPTIPQRKSISAVLGIDADAWDALPAEPVTQSDSQRLARKLYEDAGKMIAEANGDGIAPEKRWQAMSRAAAIVSKLSRITDDRGDRLEITEAKVLRLPAWRRIEREIRIALAPYPDAARAVLERLQRLEGLGGDES